MKSMNPDEIVKLLLVASCLILVAFISGVLLGGTEQKRDFQRQAVKCKVGFYADTNGQFYLKNLSNNP